MDDDVKRVIYLTIIGFLVVVLSWLGLDLCLLLWFHSQL